MMTVGGWNRSLTNFWQLEIDLTCLWKSKFQFSIEIFSLVNWQMRRKLEVVLWSRLNITTVYIHLDRACFVMTNFYQPASALIFLDRLDVGQELNKSIFWHTTITTKVALKSESLVAQSGPTYPSFPSVRGCKMRKNGGNTQKMHSWRQEVQS